MKKLVTYSIDNDILEQLDKLPRNKVPNKSALVERLLKNWLKDRGKDEK